jgi:thiol-disulfide isomerase/thioredoxin
MPLSIFDRLIWAAAIAGTGLLLFRLMNAGLLRRATARAKETSLIRPGRPAILYFTTPDCAACKAVQRPALDRLEARLGRRLTVVEVNAYERPDLAKDWGVMSVPTTFILDSQGRPQHVNHGVTPAEKLLEQLQKAGL